MKRIPFTQALLCLMIFLGLPSLQAKVNSIENDKILYLDKRGTVLRVRPATFTFKTVTEKVKVTVFKTGGKAATRVDIYVDNQLKAGLDFKNGNKTENDSWTLGYGKGKTIKVVITNLSATNRFQYRLLCEGIKDPPRPEGPICLESDGSGRVQGGQTVTVATLRPKCNTISITATRLRGRAAGQALIYENGQLFATLDLPRGVGPQSKNTVRVGVRNKVIRIVLKNLSDDDYFDYSYRTGESENNFRN